MVTTIVSRKAEEGAFILGRLTSLESSHVREVAKPVFSSEIWAPIEFLQYFEEETKSLYLLLTSQAKWTVLQDQGSVKEFRTEEIQKETSKDSEKDRFYEWVVEKLKKETLLGKLAEKEQKWASALLFAFNVSRPKLEKFHETKIISPNPNLS